MFELKLEFLPDEYERTTKILGKGSFGVIMEGRNNKTKQVVAMKFIQKDELYFDIEKKKSVENSISIIQKGYF